MSAELIGIIASSIAPGGVMLASAHAVRQEVRDVRRDPGAVRTELRDEMPAGFKKLARLVDICDRLSKVEGIIEEMFRGTRNQQPVKPRESAA